MNFHASFVLVQNKQAFIREKSGGISRQRRRERERAKNKIKGHSVFYRVSQQLQDCRFDYKGHVYNCKRSQNVG